MTKSLIAFESEQTPSSTAQAANAALIQGVAGCLSNPVFASFSAENARPMEFLSLMAASDGLSRILIAGKAIPFNAVFAVPALLPRYDRQFTNDAYESARFFAEQMLRNIVAYYGGPAKSNVRQMAELFLVAYGKDLNVVDLLRFQSIIFSGNRYKTDTQHPDTHGVTQAFLDSWIAEYLDERVEAFELLNTSRRYEAPAERPANATICATNAFSVAGYTIGREGDKSAATVEAQRDALAKKVSDERERNFEKKLQEFECTKSRMSRRLFRLFFSLSATDPTEIFKTVYNRLACFEASQKYIYTLSTILDDRIKSEWIYEIWHFLERGNNTYLNANIAKSVRSSLQEQYLSDYDPEDISGITFDQFAHKVLCALQKEKGEKTFLEEVTGHFLAMSAVQLDDLSDQVRAKRVGQARQKTQLKTTIYSDSKR